MKNVVAYILYKNEKSIKDFEKQIQEKLKNNAEWRIVKKITDYDKNKRYINFEKLLNETLKGNIDIILIKNLRQFYQIIDYKMEFFMNFFNREGIEVFFLDEKISTANDLERIQIQTTILMLESKGKARKEFNSYHVSIIEKEEFENIQRKVKNNRNIEKKIYGYNFIDGKYQINENEATEIREKIEEEIEKVQKEEKRKNANKSRSEKMKLHWENEIYRKQIIEKMKIAREFKKLREGRYKRV